MATAPVKNCPGEGVDLGFPSPVAFDSALRHAPAAATAAVVTLAAVAGKRNVLGRITGSYSAAPTGGLLTVEDGAGTVVWRVAITAAGPFDFAFDPPQHGSTNTAMIVTLASGAGSVEGLVNVCAWLEG